MSELANDNFNRANESPLASPWESVTGFNQLRLVSNMVANITADADAVMRHTGITWPADQYSEVTIGANTVQDGGPAVRLQSGSAGGYFASSYDNWTHIGKWTAGVATELINFFTFGWGAGDVVRLQVAGNTLRLFINGAEQGDGVTDSTFASGQPGMHIWEGDVRFDAWAGGTGDTPGVHVVTGRGSFPIDEPAYLSIALDGIPAHLTHGAAEPPNWYHVGMVSWGAGLGIMTAHIVTRELELIALPVGMTVLHYEFASGIEATVTELATL